MSEQITEQDTRHGILNRFVRLSGGVFSLLALRGLFPASASAVEFLCCGLASTTTCPGSGSSFTCPEGYNRMYWYCCHFGRVVGCGECTTSTVDCYEGEFVCSEGWSTGHVC